MKLLLATTLLIASAMALPNQPPTQQVKNKENQDGALVTPATNILMKTGSIGQRQEDVCVGEFGFCSPSNGLNCCDNRVCTNEACSPS